VGGAREGGLGTILGGAQSGFARGAAHVPTRWLAPAYGAVTARNRERREERDGDGSFVNKTKFKVLFVNSVFLLLPVLK